MQLNSNLNEWFHLHQLGIIIYLLFPYIIFRSTFKDTLY